MEEAELFNAYAKQNHLTFVKQICKYFESNLPINIYYGTTHFCLWYFDIKTLFEF